MVYIKCPFLMLALNSLVLIDTQWLCSSSGLQGQITLWSLLAGLPCASDLLFQGLTWGHNLLRNFRAYLGNQCILKGRSSLTVGHRSQQINLLYSFPFKYSQEKDWKQPSMIKQPVALDINLNNTLNMFSLLPALYHSSSTHRDYGPQ